jgi:hypothetical protein
MFIHSQNAFTKRLNAHNILTCMIYANVVMSLLLNIRENIHNRHYSYLAYHVFDLHPEVDTICSLSVFVSVSDTICVRIWVREKITICIRSVFIPWSAQRPHRQCRGCFLCLALVPSCQRTKWYLPTESYRNWDLIDQLAVGVRWIRVWRVTPLFSVSMQLILVGYSEEQN